ncbi:LacI family DNA-binding transcriptional regulator [Raineyella sp. W15-4]|uniref:LacI family DNA-binding transcriptional regulator n=1 Tax=Raineyella sp. W15-4 TaxID=3081651 RepID=UPI002954A3A0|nr:LacI family DNA-binding transcriptional regulator [Raineyella sp. W15-4]WOQ17106.1 LacI family DNA-binding transcriptional regulator [Raineyella sp. W15-4]
MTRHQGFIINDHEVSQAGDSGRLPTMEDVAREAGVSRALVSIVYRGVKGASEETRQRVFEAGERIGYRRNSLAARLASKGVHSIGVLLFDMRNDLTADVFQGIQAEADASDLGLVVGVSDPSGRRDERTVNDLLAARVDALIMISGTMPGSELRALSRTIPLVSATRAVTGVDSVIVDEAAAGALVVDHLVSLGHRRIVHLAPTWRPSPRVDAYVQAMTRAGLDPWVEDIAYDFDDVRAVTLRLLAATDPPTAVYANNDQAAYAVLEALSDRRLRAPEDVAVVGFDNLRASALRSVDLTSIDQQPVALGRLAVRTALTRAVETEAPPRREVLAPRLVVRRSTVDGALED